MVKLAERMAVAALIGFGSVATAGSGSLKSDVIGAAIGAAARAVYAVLVAAVGPSGPDAT